METVEGRSCSLRYRSVRHRPARVRPPERARAASGPSSRQWRSAAIASSLIPPARPASCGSPRPRFSAMPTARVIASAKVAASERAACCTASTTSRRTAARAASGLNGPSVTATILEAAPGRGLGARSSVAGEHRREAQRQHHVARAGERHLLRGELGDVVDQRTAHAELAEGIGEIGGHREEAPGAEQVDDLGLGQKIDGAVDQGGSARRAC